MLDGDAGPTPPKGHSSSNFRPAHSLPCTRVRQPAGFDSASPSAAVCGATLRACSLLPAVRTAAAVPFGVQSAESCFAGQLVEWRLAVFGSSLLTTDHRLLIDFHNLIIEYDNKLSLTTLPKA